MADDLLTIGVFSLLAIAAYSAFAWIVFRDSNLSPRSIKLLFSLLSPALFFILMYSSFYIFSHFFPNLYEKTLSEVGQQIYKGGRDRIIFSGAIILSTLGILPLFGMFFVRFMFSIIGKYLEKIKAN